MNSLIRLVLIFKSFILNLHIDYTLYLFVKIKNFINFKHFVYFDNILFNIECYFENESIFDHNQFNFMHLLFDFNRGNYSNMDWPIKIID